MREGAAYGFLLVGALALAGPAGCGDDGDGGGESTPTEERTDEATEDGGEDAIDPESVDVCGLLSDEDVESLMGVEPNDSGLASEGEDYEGQYICEWSTDPSDRSDLRGVVAAVGLLENRVEGYDDLEDYLEEGTNTDVQPLDDVGEEAFFSAAPIGSFTVYVVEGGALFELSVVGVDPPEPGSSEYDDAVELAAELPGRAS